MFWLRKENVLQNRVVTTLAVFVAVIAIKLSLVVACSCYLWCKLRDWKYSVEVSSFYRLKGLVAARSFSVYFTSTSMYMVFHRLFKKHRRKKSFTAGYPYFSSILKNLMSKTWKFNSKQYQPQRHFANVSRVWAVQNIVKDTWYVSPIFGGPSLLPWGRKYVKILFSGSSSCTYVKLCLHRATASALVLTLRRDIMDSHCSIQRDWRLPWHLKIGSRPIPWHQW